VPGGAAGVEIPRVPGVILRPPSRKAVATAAGRPGPPP